VAVVLAIGYTAFIAYSDSQTRPSASAVNANALQEFAVAPQRSAPTPPDARETDKAIASLIDQFETAMAQELSGTRSGGTRPRIWPIALRPWQRAPRLMGA
jgi:hypothetical protein